MTGDQRYGVSPAFFLSLFGERFMPGDVISALPLVKEMGFDCFQCEIVSEDKLAFWEAGGAVAVAGTARKNGLQISQFVAHFMLRAFQDREILYSEFGLREMDRMFQVARQMEFHGPITVPMGPFDGLEHTDAEEKCFLREQLGQKMRSIVQLASGYGNPIAIEVQPKALISGASEIFDFMEATGTGYNYDTGHAWASGATNIAQFPLLMGDRILGTHLCDNDGIENLSLCPGEGSINWAEVMKNLKKTCCRISLDLEIFTQPDLVKCKYIAGRSYLQLRMDTKTP